MRINIILALTFIFLQPAKAQIEERPLKLNDQAELNKQEDDYFPAATEPYNANASAPSETYKPAPAEAYKPTQDNGTYNPPHATESYNPPQTTGSYNSPMVIRNRVYTPPPVSQPAAAPMRMPAAPSYGGMTSGFPATREVIEQAASKCDEEVAAIWQQQQGLDQYRRQHFQKCVGEAKMRCDALKRLAANIKTADEQLLSYQQAIQNSQNAYNE